MKAKNVKSKIIVAEITSSRNQDNILGHFLRVSKMYKKIFFNNHEVLFTNGPVYKNYFEDKEMLPLEFDFNFGNNNNKIFYSKIIENIKNIWLKIENMPKKSKSLYHQRNFNLC